MDETFETPAEPEGDPSAEDHGTTLAGAGNGADEVTPPFGTEPVTAEVPTAVMPLSMPPFASGAETGPAAADAVDPPVSAPRHRGIFAAAAALALVAGGVGATLGATLTSSGSDSNGTSAATSIPNATNEAPAGTTGSISRINAVVSPAVVDINTTIATIAGSSPERAAGTGMIVTSDGEVLTNNHVIENATSINVTIQGRKGSYKARVLGTDQTHDVALIKVQGVSHLPVVSLGNSSSVAVGSNVVAIGNALGLGGSPTVVPGIISAKGRAITAGGAAQPEQLSGLLQTNAQIAPGDSGGPLVNSKGQVIGMNTAASQSDGTGATIGFAIPINQARSIAQAIERGRAGNGVVIGLSAYIGAQVAPMSQSSFGGGLGNFGDFGGFGFNFGTGTGNATAPANGVAINGVVGGGPAEAAGLEGGDVITAINGQKLTGNGSVTQFEKVLAAHKPGDRVSISYTDTNGANHTLSVKLGGIPK